MTNTFVELVATREVDRSYRATSPASNSQLLSALIPTAQRSTCGPPNSALGHNIQWSALPPAVAAACVEIPGRKKNYHVDHLHTDTCNSNRASDALSPAADRRKVLSGLRIKVALSAMVVLVITAARRHDLPSGRRHLRVADADAAARSRVEDAARCRRAEQDHRAGGGRRRDQGDQVRVPSLRERRRRARGPCRGERRR